jgi:hypothetical protein
MKMRIHPFLSAGLLLAISLAPLPAGPINRADLPAQPGFVLHLDCDALRPTAIGRYLLAEMSKPDADNKFAAFQAMFSFDPRTALHGMTIYSAGGSSEDGVVAVYADFEPGRLVTMAKAAKDYQAASHRQHTIHNWIDEKKKANKEGVKPRTYAAIHGNRVVFGQREAAVAGALDVLDGVAPNLSTSKAFPELGGAGKGFLQASARKLDLPAGDPSAAMFRLAQAMRLNVLESGGMISARLAMDANSEEVAGHMASIASGLLSLVKLQKDKPENLKLADALSLKAEGATFNVSLELPSNDVVDMMKADAARKAAKKVSQ